MLVLLLHIHRRAFRDELREGASIVCHAATDLPDTGVCSVRVCSWPQLEIQGPIAALSIKRVRVASVTPIKTSCEHLPVHLGLQCPGLVCADGTQAGTHVTTSLRCTNGNA